MAIGAQGGVDVWASHRLRSHIKGCIFLLTNNYCLLITFLSNLIFLYKVIFKKYSLIILLFNHMDNRSKTQKEDICRNDGSDNDAVITLPFFTQLRPGGHGSSDVISYDVLPFGYPIADEVPLLHGTTHFRLNK